MRLFVDDTPNSIGINDVQVNIQVECASPPLHNRRGIEKVEYVKQFLDRQANFFKSQGFDVKRLSVPLHYTYDDVFVQPTYINATFVHGKDRKIILVPRYGHAPALSQYYADKNLFTEYENAVIQLYEKDCGHRVVW